MYLVWAIMGGFVTLVLVFLCYMGFFSYIRIAQLTDRKVFCTAEEMEEMILAFPLRNGINCRFDNCIGPYQEMDNHCREFRRRIEDLLQGYIKVSKQVNIYYDDPRFPSNSRVSSFTLRQRQGGLLRISCLKRLQIVCRLITFRMSGFLQASVYRLCIHLA